MNSLIPKGLGVFSREIVKKRHFLVHCQILKINNFLNFNHKKQTVVENYEDVLKKFQPI